MSMSPRLLRPRQTGFSPRSISGLALWLDGADSSSLYTTSLGSVEAVSSPLDIPNCAGWWDASDASTLFDATSGGSQVTNGGAVARWNDKTTLGRHVTQATSANRPTYSASAAGGKGALSWGASLNSRSLAWASGSNNTVLREVFVVCSYDGGTTFNGFEGLITGTAADNANVGLSAPGSGATTFYTASNFSIWDNLIINGANSGAYSNIVASGGINGWPALPALNSLSVLHAFGAADQASNGICIGNDRSFADRGWRGNICEVVAYSATLTDTQRVQVQKYLAARWPTAFVDNYRPIAQEITAVESPLDIPDCALWLDAADASTLFDATSGGSQVTTGGAVARWNDKSGRGRHATQGTSANRPAYSGSIGGKAALTFDGTDDAMATGLESASLTGYATFFCVCRPSFADATAANNRTPLYGRDSTASNSYGINLLNTSGTLTLNTTWRGFQFNAIGGPTVTLGLDAILVGGITATQHVRRVSGVAANFVSTPTAGTNSAAGNFLNVGQDPTQLRWWNGPIGEVLVYNRDLSVTEIQRVEKYLAAKWGIANVPDPTPPVGYWGDKSGNNRHAVQATAGNRPTLSVAARNSRNAVNMTGGACSVVATISLSQPNSYAFVYRTLATTTSAALFDGTSSRQNMNSATFGSGTDLQVFAGTANRPIGGALGLSQWRLVYASLDGASSVGSVDSPSTGFLIGNPGTSGIGTGIRIGALINQTSGHVGPIAEFLMFSRSLTAGEWTRLSRYLAAKWNIALAPQVSNADAQDWINRVYSNGGTVSTSTAAAVNDFCNAIDAGVGGVSMRDRFYRLNLFCGNSDSALAAVRTPLYRGQSLGGAQFGGTTDTNTGNLFQPNDYAETGSNGGLLGNGSTKHLNTGLNADAIPNLAQSGHLSVYAAGTFSSQIAIGVYTFTNPPFVITHESEIQTGPTTAGVFINSALAGPVTPTYTSPVFVVASRTSSTNIVAYANGVGGTASTATASMTNPASPFLVFARNLNGTATAHFGQRLRAYSIGEGMTGPQVSAFNTAMQAFQTALSRNA